MIRRRKAIRALRRWEADTRTRSWHHARALAVAIVEGTADSPVPYDLGIVLDPGERVWHRCPGTYQWRTTISWTEQRVSYRGYRSTAHEVTVPRMMSSGMTDWIITDQRLATRQHDGQIISIYWTAITGLSVDLDAEGVVLEGLDGYHGELTGPTIAPIAVAAIAACHGPRALLDHPALTPLRSVCQPSDGAKADPHDRLVQGVPPQSQALGRRP